MASALSTAVQWWTGIYANHAVLRTAVSFAHIGGLVGGGGCAIAADYTTLVLRAESSVARTAHLESIRRTHRAVILGLVLLFVSGLLLLAADLETYLSSRVFWLKMALIAALLVNGVAVTRAERHVLVRQGDWSRLRRVSVVSAVLWFLTTLLGAALPNIG